MQATFANMKRRVQLCLDSGGEHFQHLLQYRHASHEARYVVIYACSKYNEQSLRYSHFLGSSTERIALYLRCVEGVGIMADARWERDRSATCRQVMQFTYSRISREGILVFVPVETTKIILVMSCVHQKGTLESILNASRSIMQRKATLDASPFRVWCLDRPCSDTRAERDGRTLPFPFRGTLKYSLKSKQADDCHPSLSARWCLMYAARSNE